MSEKKDFYHKIHCESPEYSGATYDVAGLTSSRPFKRWVRGQSRCTVNILDIGCGKGFFLRDFINLVEKTQLRVIRAVGIDLVRSEGNVFSQVSGRYEFVEGSVDGEPLPFPDNSFEIIACNHILEHIFETEYLLREIRRVITPEGIAVISVPNIAAWINRLLFLFASQPLGSEVGTEASTYGFWPAVGQRHLGKFKPAGHVRDFTPRALEDMCCACGLRVEGWWNQSQTPLFPLTRWAGRNMGVLAVVKEDAN